MTFCLRGFSICNCSECKIIKSYKQTEKKLSEINKQYNKQSKIYSNYIEKLRSKNPYKVLQLNSNYDSFTKTTWLKIEELEAKSKKLVYRLNSLEKKADLYGINLNEVLIQ